ncbi:MAG: oligosaccharide flippase family protein [Deltaproteobacteria bacterium]|nr:oligosaccharide flippase family protein [Deltaproteobacteria bacterium]
MTPLDIKKDSKLKSGMNLMIVQFALYFIPLITIPYVVKTVGIENYGKYVFFQAVMGLLGVIINWGFIQTGVRDISVCKTLDEINREYSHILYSKLLALFIACAIGSALFLFGMFRAEWELYSLSFLALPVIFLDTAFLYQGIEKLKDFVNISLAGNLCVLALLFLTVREEGDYRLLPMVFSAPRILAYLFSIYFLHYRFRIVPNAFSLSGVYEKLRSNFSIFATNISAILYTRATQVILGVAAGTEFVGYYAVADQLVFAYSNIQGKISTVYQPQIAQAFKDDFNEAVVKARENTCMIFLAAMAGFLFTQFFAPEILYFLFKDRAAGSVHVLRILSVNFVTMHLSYIMAMQILLSLHREWEILKPSIYAAILNLTLGSALIYFFRHTGAALSVALIEVIICVYFYLKVKGYGIDVLDRKMLMTLLNFVVSLLFILSGLKFLYVITDVSVYVKFPLVTVFYALSILLALKALNIIDFKKRKLLIGQVAINDQVESEDTRAERP